MSYELPDVIVLSEHKDGSIELDSDFEDERITPLLWVVLWEGDKEIATRTLTLVEARDLYEALGRRLAKAGE